MRFQIIEKTHSILRQLLFIICLFLSFNVYAAPGISDIWPADAAIGENISVFIFGSEFTTNGTTEVYFNGVRQWMAAPVSTDMLIVRLAPVTDIRKMNDKINKKLVRRHITGE